MTIERSPFGSWPTPITSEVVVRGAAVIDGLVLDGDDVYWSERRPENGGRSQVVRLGDGGAADLLPSDADVRTAVHEYGGGGWWVDGGALWWVEWADQLLRRTDLSTGETVVVVEGPAVPRAVRWADGEVHPSDGRLAVVRETHPDGGGPADVINEVVLLSADGSVEVVVSGPDFVSNPRWSPDGDSLAWVEWDHPDMPWDATRLKVLRGDDIVTVAGGPDESVLQPEWHADGSLWFLSDRSGWWNLYRWDGAVVTSQVEVECEIGVPPWVFGLSRYGFLSDGRLVYAVFCDGADTVVVRDRDGSSRALDVGARMIQTLRVSGDRVVVVGGTPRSGPAVREVRVDGDSVTPPTILSPVVDRGIGLEWFSVPEHFSFPGHGGGTSHAYFSPPTNPDHAGPEGERPPVLVRIHGGPTAQATPVLAMGEQYWTSRGFAIVDVDYAGSTGYGRAYRNRLRGTWGVADVEDCIAVVKHLAAEGRIDPAKAVIRGGSAGGFTTLAALARSDVFAAGASHYGIADLEALAAETHKFESRYLDRLIAPYPSGRDVYVERSPLTHVDDLTSPLAVFQGSEDAVVPPNQAEMIVEALRTKGIRVLYRLYEGEQHGFRDATNIRDALDSELTFYGEVLGFSPCLPG
ncbi:alpha/beta hydrolase family protein [Nocardioides sp. Kera G14]|uniref:dipeptidyl-peptidase 5 n=1 Tax=Nocardioides sp. Kera G14 TaxID=2884264 RepID=UPI001D11CBFB|nr:S9 family peptidase [Nocardioides sp. Kera G14]UDY24462.1 S9 family peptidase [Nocardioides sp. Kera G14]